MHSEPEMTSPGAAVHQSLPTRLGHRADARLVIINCADLGTCHAANVGIYEALDLGLATSATLAVPAPWSREAAYRYRGEDIGVQLMVNSDWDRVRWGPITQAPSLLDGDGGFPRTVIDTWDHADLDEIRRECRAQLERAILWGFDVSHLDSHLSALQLRPEFFDIFREIATDFNLPVSLPTAGVERQSGFPFRQLASDEGLLFPDHLIVVGPTIGIRELERKIFDLEPGVTEIQVRPAVNTAELRAATPDWASRVENHDLLTADRRLRIVLERAGVILTGYRELRAAQMAG